jgi:type IV secretory pathway VirB2 component (pilin)
MFDSINNLLDAVFTEFRSLGMTIFAIGIIVMAMLTAFGGEENKRSFQRGFVVCLFGLVVFFLAKPIITFIRTTL